MARRSRRPNHTPTQRQRRIWCCECAENVNARLTDGAEVYPHRADLAALPFWKCDTCGNHVGCHHKTPNRTKPLGCIPNAAIKRMRMAIHGVIDPLWKQGLIKRPAIYAALGGVLGREYHTADIRSMDEAKAVYRAAIALRDRMAA